MPLLHQLTSIMLLDLAHLIKKMGKISHNYHIFDMNILQIFWESMKVMSLDLEVLMGKSGYLYFLPAEVTVEKGTCDGM